jgi:predicted AlkP superfamily phosphohydrolase/phosphomutase
MEKSHKIVIVGWDGATWDLLRPWVENGDLPGLGRIVAEGAAGEMRTIFPPTTAPAWTSMTTGTNPGRHGLLDWITRQPSGYNSVPFTASHCSQKTIWELMSEAGRRVFTFNVPMTYPPRPLNGLVVGGLGVPSVEAEFTYPPELYREIVDVVGEYILHPNPGQPDTDRRVEAFIERLYRVTDIHQQTLDHLRAKEDWDAWMAVISGTDAVQHVMWRFLDPNHSQYDPAKGQRFGGEALRYFQYVDLALSKLMDSLDEDTVLFLVSDHGFGALNKWFHVNTWLLQQGFISLKPGVWPRIKRRLFQWGLTPMNVYTLLRTLGLGRLKEEVTTGRGRGRLRALLPLLFLSFEDVDWSRTRAYALGQIGPIYFNLKGREPQGIVEPGQGAEALRAEIVSRLRQVRDPESGELVVGDIYRPEDLYAGPYLAKAPDVIFAPKFDVKRGQTPGFGEVDFGTSQIIAPMHHGVSGVHRMNGVFAAWGAPIRRGVWLEGTQIVDVAPTALHLAGLPVPEDMDGRVLVDALLPEYADPASIHYGPPAVRVEVGEAGFLSAEDQALVEERLRGLGYAA